MVILYSNGCPKCNILKKKLAEKNIQYQENTSVNEMLSLGIINVPVLQVDNVMLNFSDAITWINS